MYLYFHTHDEISKQFKKAQLHRVKWLQDFQNSSSHKAVGDPTIFASSQSITHLVTWPGAVEALHLDDPPKVVKKVGAPTAFADRVFDEIRPDEG